MKNIKKEKKFIMAGLYPFPHSVGYYHNINAALIVLDKTRAQTYSYEEEKLSSVKNDYLGRFAERSFMLGCKELGIIPKDIDYFIVSRPAGVEKKKVYEWIFRDILKIKQDAEIIEVPHHLGHAGLAVYGSGFDEGIFISIDGGGDSGDQRDFIWGVFKNKKMKVRGECFAHQGLAYLHYLVTESSGFAFLEDGKAMGLGSYGKLVPEVYRFLKEKVIIENKICVKCLFSRSAASDFRMHKLKAENYDRPKVTRSPEGGTDFYDFVKIYPAQDVIFTVQKFLEEIMIELVDYLVKVTKGKYKNLVLGGGFFQNILINKILYERRKKWGFNSIYIPMGCGDNGLSLGFCLYAWYNILGKDTAYSFFERDEKGYLTPFLGPSFSNEEIEKSLKDYGLKYEFIKNEEILLNKVIDFICKGKIIGWFQGRAELGPRSLLARSVLADPRNKNIKDRVNQLLKKRDWFMPFAPVVLSRGATAWFKNYIYSPYMTIAFDVYLEKQALIPSAIHIDGTSRPNSISYKVNPLSYNLVKRFFGKTGIPLILNTSFNRHGISTIATPRQAVDHLLAENIEVLVIGNFIAYRKFVPKKFGADKIVNPLIFELLEYVKPIIRLAYFGSKEEMTNRKEAIKKELALFASKNNYDIKIDLEVGNLISKIEIDNKFLLEIPTSGKKSIDIYFDEAQQYLLNKFSK